MKNIVLCSDGTGNKGGSTPDSNVYRIYNALDNTTASQVSFYDNGVGTSTNKYWRALTGAFGIGFNKNVMDLYEFLVRNYEPDDRIFLFGFSRGAATVRAFAGMLQVVGLLDRRKQACLGEDNLQAMLERARVAYLTRPKPLKTDPAWEQKVAALRSDGMLYQGQDWRIPITFLGVWDTVSALGFPRDWSRTIDWLFSGLDHWLDKVFHQNAYEYQLDDKVACACHALALDDERRTFHPHVFWEKPDPRGRYTQKDRPKQLHQVWFAGMHSNVGGGYERAGMASVALHWMMCWAVRHGLELDKEAIDDAEAASNVTDKLYDSRDGLAAYYRYGPREIDRLWGDRFDGPIKVHSSVETRIKRGTARYAPGFLPYQIAIADTPGPDPKDVPPVPKVRQTAPSEDKWKENRRAIDGAADWRKLNYSLFAETTLIWVMLAVLLAFFPVAVPFPGAADDHSVAALVRLADVLLPLVPGFLEPFVVCLFIAKQVVGVVFLLWLAAFWLSGWATRRGDLAAREKARAAYLATNTTYNGAFKGPLVPLLEPKPVSKEQTRVAHVVALGVWGALIAGVGYGLFHKERHVRACGDYAGRPTCDGVCSGPGATVWLHARKAMDASGLILAGGRQYRVAFDLPPGGINRIPREGKMSVPANANPRVTAAYRKSVPVDSPKHWLDASVVVDPAKGWWPRPADGTFLYAWTEVLTAFTKWGFLRMPGANLAVPVAVIRGPCRDGLTCQYQFPVRPGGSTVTAPGSGEFCAYSNDLPFMEFNNKGALALTISTANP